MAITELQDIKKILKENKDKFSDFEKSKEKAEFCYKEIQNLNIGDSASLATYILPFYRSNEDVFQGIDEETLNLLNGTLVLDNIDMGNRENTLENSEYLKNMFINMSKDIRIVFIKLNDLVYDAHHAKEMDKDARFKLFTNIEEVFAPLAARLGLTRIKAMLQDASCEYFHPKEFQSISLELAELQESRFSNIEEIESSVRGVLTELKIKGEAKSRIKRVSSIWNKLKNQK